MRSYLPVTGSRALGVPRAAVGILVGRAGQGLVTCLLVALSLVMPVQQEVLAQDAYHVAKNFAPDGHDGFSPIGDLAEGPDGWLYGLTRGYGGPPEAGSAVACASAFRFRPDDPDGTFQTVWVSKGQGGPGCLVYYNGIVAAGDGNLYFATFDGGTCNSGLIFKLSPPSTVTVVTDFGVNGPDDTGQHLVCHYRTPSHLGAPEGGLTVGPDGALYGTAKVADATHTGGVFRVGLEGSLTEVVAFSETNPVPMQNGLVLGSDGMMYGTAALNHALVKSTIYRVNTSTGAVQNVYAFDDAVADGWFPRGRLVEIAPRPGFDIAFVGVTQAGGLNNTGVIYRVDVRDGVGTLLKLYEPGYGDGGAPVAGVTVAPGGAIYGTTFGWGYSDTPINNGAGPGTIFKIADGVGTVLHSDSLLAPSSALIQHNGALYGLSALSQTQTTPRASLGSIFRLTLATPGEITLTSPNTAARWKLDTKHRISWTTRGLQLDDSMLVSVSRDGGTTWSTIAGGVRNKANGTGSYRWTVDGPLSDRARIRVESFSDHTVQDASEVDFQIGSRIRITAPRKATAWSVGSLRAVQWTHNYGLDQDFDIGLSADGGVTWRWLATNVPAATKSTGAYSLVVPNLSATDAQILVSPAGRAQEGDVTDVPFEILAPMIQVTAPTARARWTRGTTHVLHWTHNLGVNERVAIEFSADGGSTWTMLAPAVSNRSATNGSYSWTVPDSATTSAVIRISWAGHPSVNDVSDGAFEIR